MKTVTKTLLIHQVVMDQSQDVTLFCQFGNRNAPLVAYLGISSLRKLNDLAYADWSIGGLKLLESMAYAIMECNEDSYRLYRFLTALGLPLVVLDVPAELIFCLS